MRAMRRHLSEQSLLDLAESGGGSAERAHVAACVTCSSRVEDLRATLAAASRADVPEPSPLYWEAMRRNVGRRIAEEPTRSWSAWLAPAVATAAVAVVAVALTIGRPVVPRPVVEPPLPSWSALPPAEDDPSLAVIEGLAMADGSLGAMEEGRGVGAFLAGLSDEDYQALEESLRNGGKGGQS